MELLKEDSVVVFCFLFDLIFWGWGWGGVGFIDKPWCGCFVRCTQEFM